MNRKLTALAALTAVLMGVAACGSGPDPAAEAVPPGGTADVTLLGGQANADHLADLYQRSTEAGQHTITVYGITATSSAALYEAFSRRFPEISVNHVTIFGPELQNRIASEQLTRQFVVDNVSVSGADAAFVADQGFVAEQSPPLAADLPAEYKPAGNTLFGANSYIYTLGYNSEMVADNEAPRTWDDLLDPRWAGQIGITDPTIAGIDAISLAVQRGELDSSWIERFAATNPVVFPSERELFTAVSTGQIAMGYVNYIRGPAFLAQDDLPVRFVGDFSNVSLGTFYRGTVRNAPNALASDLLVAWWLTPEAQALIAEQGQPGSMPGAPPVPGYIPLSEMHVIPSPALSEYAAFRTYSDGLWRAAFGDG